MNITFSKKLTASYLFVVAVTLACAAIYLSPRLKATYLQHLEQSLAIQGRLMAQSLPVSRRNWQAWSTQQAQISGCRITLIDPTGAVLADSERKPEELLLMDNHGHRPEVEAALAQGIGESMRHSSTLHEDLLYLALPLPNGRGVLRMALPLTTVHERIHSFRKNLLKAGIAALLIALLVAWITMRKISEPLRSVLNHMGPDAKDDIGHLSKTYSEMTRRVEDKVRDLAIERKQQGAMLSALIESILAVDHQGKVLFLNPAAQSLFGIPSENVTGRPVVEVLRHRALTELLEHTLTTQERTSREITLHTPDERILSAQAVPVSYGEGQTGALVALHDVTELRKLESVRREFVANVSHELKTPLTSIQGYAETLLDGAIDDPKNSRDFIKIIQEHTKNLSRLIDDVLDLSAIEADRVHFNMQPQEVQDIIHRILKALEPMAKSKKVELIQDLPKNLPKILADKEKIAQVFMNLLENAIKFNQEGGKVSLKAHAEGRNVVITIQDSGRGIAPNDLPRVFERFYRGNKDRSHEIPGTGLGLAIVKHLTDAHHGSLSVKSKVGEGTTFTLTLPQA